MCACTYPPKMAQNGNQCGRENRHGCVWSPPEDALMTRVKHLADFLVGIQFSRGQKHSWPEVLLYVLLYHGWWAQSPGLHFCDFSSKYCHSSFTSLPMHSDTPSALQLCGIATFNKLSRMTGGHPACEWLEVSSHTSGRHQPGKMCSAFKFCHLFVLPKNAWLIKRGEINVLSEWEIVIMAIFYYVMCFCE